MMSLSRLAMLCVVVALAWLVFSPPATDTAAIAPPAETVLRDSMGVRAADTMQAILGAIMPSAGPDTAADVVLVPHKAMYSFRMLGLGSGGGLSDIRGNMFYEQGDACDAWTTDHRFTSEYFYPERPAILNSSQYVAWEAKDGSLFQFNSERQESEAVSEEKLLRGAVSRSPDGTATAVYSRPSGLSYALPAGYYLPTQHTIEVIRRARKGDKIFNAVLFDGTDAEGPVEINTIIIRRASAEEMTALVPPATAGIQYDLLASPAWHVRMAVFPLQPKEGEDSTMPSYEMAMVIHENGVVSDAVVDYQKFKVAQRLTALATVPAAPCSER